MICTNCRTAADDYDGKKSQRKRQMGKKLHAVCFGKTHCDCQHRPGENQTQTVLVPK